MVAPRIFIVGASTRAAAHSAVRTGVQPVCADVFADVDLRSVATVLPVVNYPRGLEAAVESAPDCPWMYTGALENHPGLIERIAGRRRLLGNGADAVRAVRDPWRLRSLLNEAGLPCLDLWPKEGAALPPVDGAWMLKPRRGAAGRGIVRWDSSAVGSATLREPHYFQRRREGTPVSALFLALPGETRLLGLTRQLVGLSEVHAPPFAWCGTIAPAALPPHIEEVAQRVGEEIGTRLPLRGLFGCDFLVDDEAPWLTEVNPRYTGAMEIVEHLLHVPLVGWHCRACAAFDGGPAATRDLDRLQAEIASAIHQRPARVLGKVVLYAGRDGVAGDWTRFLGDPSRFHPPFAADLPAPGQPLRRGQPVCTLFATADTPDDCLHKLLRRARRRTFHLL